MSAYLTRRLLSTIPVVFAVSLLVFSMLHLVPGDPVKLMLSEFQTSPEQIARLRAQLHFDDPLPVQFGRYVWNALQGDLGLSIRSKRPVATEIAEQLPATLQLTIAGLLVAMLIGTTFGIVAAINHQRWVDVTSMFIALLGVSMPSFWLGLNFIFLFSLTLRWLPATGSSEWRHLIMPALTLGLGASAILARLTRSSMLEVMRREYVTTARAKGVREFWVIVKHALKNALIPMVTVFGLQFGQLMAGAVVIETVFARPGLGRLLVSGILEKDFPLVQGIVLVVAMSYVLVNLVVDLVYALLDPRIRYD